MTSTAERRWFKELGERPCERCGRPHACHWIGNRVGVQQTWQDPEDGHAYAPISWEQMYRREVERHAVEATGSAEPS